MSTFGQCSKSCKSLGVKRPQIIEKEVLDAGMKAVEQQKLKEKVNRNSKVEQK